MGETRIGRIKLYVKGRRRPLFVCEFEAPDDGGAPSLIRMLGEQLEDPMKEIIFFGQIAFRKIDFDRYEIHYLKRKA